MQYHKLEMSRFYFHSVSSRKMSGLRLYTGLSCPAMGSRSSSLDSKNWTQEEEEEIVLDLELVQMTK